MKWPNGSTIHLFIEIRALYRADDGIINFLWKTIMSKYNYYIPHNLELDKLVYQNPPRFKPFKKQKLLYILSLINELRLSNKDLVYNSYTQINAHLLQETVQNYKQYFDYLINDLRIIESDDRYIPEKKSKGFRFIDKYQTMIKPYKVTDFVMRKNMKVKQNKAFLTVEKLDYLTKWFDEGLEIDFDKCYNFSRQEFKLKQQHQHLRDYDMVNKKYKIPINQFNSSLIAVNNIDNGCFFLKRDENVNRFHSGLTNINSILRNAITYRGEKLISIDIANSQPYLSTLLLTEEFWKRSEDSIKYNNNNKIQLQDIFNYYIMLGEMAVSPMNKEVLPYVELVRGGEFYEYLQKRFKEELGLEYADRKQVKAAVFQTLFTHNSFIGQKEAAPKRIFAKCFPEVYKIFKLIKSKDKSLLPRLLQSIESYLMIDIICKRIAKEFPEAPIFTIHDSVATTETYLDDVVRIIEEECEKAIGFAPKLKLEHWNPENMDEHLSELAAKAHDDVA